MLRLISLSLMKRTFASHHMAPRTILIGILLILIAAACGMDGSSDSQSRDLAEEAYLSEYEGPREKWGFLDTRGQVAIEPRYDQVSAFTEGLAAANLRGKWGYIDRAGDVVIPFQYLAAWPFSNGHARVQLFEGGQCFIDLNGKAICPDGAIELGDQRGGFFKVTTEGGIGFLDQAGQYVVDPIYDRVTPFAKGYASCYRGEEAVLINSRLETVVSGSYSRIEPPASGVILVSDNDGYYFLTLEGTRSDLSVYQRATSFKHHRAAVKQDGTWKLIDTAGNVLIDDLKHLRYASSNRWIGRKETGAALIDNTGKALTSFIYSQINNIYENRATFQRENLCGYLDMQGNEVLPPQYGLAWDFHDGLARAAFRDGIAFIDSNGTVPFIPSYFEVRDYSEGRVAFQDNP